MVCRQSIALRPLMDSEVTKQEKEKRKIKKKVQRIQVGAMIAGQVQSKLWIVHKRAVGAKECKQTVTECH